MHGHPHQREIERLLMQSERVAPHAQRPLMQRVLQLVNQCPPPMGSIPADQVHPPSSKDMIVPLMAPSRYLVLPAAPLVAPTIDSAGVRLEFSSGGGWLIGWRATAIDVGPPGAAGAFEQAQMGVRIELNDGENIITNGVGQDFASFATLFADATHWTPLMRRVDVKDVLNVFFRNFNAVGGASLTPRVTFAFWRPHYPGVE